MEQIAITTQYDLESRKKLVRYIAGMSGGDRDALSKQRYRPAKAQAASTKNNRAPAGSAKK